jgi:membrane fusion protein, multidrug efflux system
MKSLILAISLVALAACGREELKHPKQTEVVRPAGETAAAVLTEWPGSYEATGTVRARTVTTIASKVMGYVQQVHVAVGDRVREGQTLVTVEARDLESNVRRADAGRAEAQASAPELEHAIAAAKANLDLAQSTYRRIEELAGKKSVSQQELDEAAARLKAAQAQHEMALARRAQLQSRIAQADAERSSAQIMRDYAEIRAPFAAVVTEKNAESGTLAAPGAPLLTLEREGGYRLEVSVEESRIGAARPGQSVKVALENCAAPGRVVEIVPSVDAVSRSYTVKIDLAPAAGCGVLRSGMFGRAEFPLASHKALTIPASAVVERGQLQSVNVVEHGAPQVRLISLGARRGDSVEVLTGLRDGERVEVRP